MTREEAIRNLEELLIKADITDVYGDMEDMTPYEDAVNMAIQALQDLKELSDIINQPDKDDLLKYIEIKEVIERR